LSTSHQQTPTIFADEPRLAETTTRHRSQRQEADSLLVFKHVEGLSRESDSPSLQLLGDSVEDQMK
jgi:hypothetical protein